MVGHSQLRMPYGEKNLVIKGSKYRSRYLRSRQLQYRNRKDTKNLLVVITLQWEIFRRDLVTQIFHRQIF